MTLLIGGLAVYKVIHIITSDTERKTRNSMASLPCNLANLNLNVSTGNIPNPELLNLFRKNLDIIKQSFQDVCYVELSRSYLFVHG